MDYSKPEWPHYSDKETREKTLSLMRTYFETKPAEPVPVLFKSFEVPKQNSQTTTILFDDVNRIPLDHLSDSSWKAHFPGATEDFYQKLVNPSYNTQQDLLKDENLLKELTGNVYFKLESGLKDMFWLELKSVRGLSSHIQIVGCMILTKAAPKNCNISNHKLNLLLIEIRATAARFEDAEFIHVFCELNKHADAIATAASWSVMDGIAAVNDLKWDLCIRQVGKTEEEWIVNNSLL